MSFSDPIAFKVINNSAKSRVMQISTVLVPVHHAAGGYEVFHLLEEV